MVGKCSLVNEVKDCDRILYTHTSATTAWTPIWTAEFGVLIPMVSKDANVQNEFYRGGIFNFTIATSISVANGDIVFYNTSTDTIVVVDPGSSGFLLGQATEAGSAAGGYVNVKIFSGGKSLGSFGTPATPAVMVYNGGKSLALYHTCASTNASTSFEPVYFKTTMTGAGQVGGRVKVLLNISDVALGGWANAFKAQVDCNTSGRATGLLSVGCFELTLPASNVSAVSGTYAPIEAELVAPASCTPSAATAVLLYSNLSGDSTAVAAVRLGGYLMKLDGLGSASSTANIFHTTGTVQATHGLRIDIGGVAYDILLKASTYA